MMPDYPLGQTLDFKFTSRSFSTGAPTTLAGTPVIQIYEDNSTTQITAGITLTADFDSVTGLNHLRVVATGANGFEAGKSYQAVISTGTVGGVSVVGEVIAQFSIERSPVNWANVTAPSTAVDLSATDIQLVDTATTNTDMRGTDSALLAVSAPTNFGDLSITVTTGRVDVGALAGDAQSLTDLKDFADAGYDPATNKVEGVKLVDTTTVNTDMRGTDGVDTATMRGTDLALLAVSAPTNFGDLSITLTTGRVDVALIEGVDATDQIRDSILADSTPFAGSNIDASISSRSTFDRVNEPVEIKLDTGTATGGTTSNELVEDVWDTVLTKATHDLAQSAGKRLRQLGAEVQAEGSVNDLSPSASNFDTTLTKADGFFDHSEAVFTTGALTGQSRPLDAFLNAGGNCSFEEPYTTAPADGDEFEILVGHVHSLANIAGAVWDRLTSALTLAGSIGKFLTDRIDVVLSTRSSHTANDVTNDIDANSTKIGQIAAETAALIVEIDTATGEPGQVFPSATLKRGEKTDFLYKWARNKSDQTATLWQGYNDTGSAVDQKRTVSDDGTTFTAEEIGTGP